MNLLPKAHRGLLFFFLIYGFGVASWAPMVPLAKISLALSDAKLGIILLSLGVGSIIAMPISGFCINHFGSRAITIFSCFVLAFVLPLLINATSALQLSCLLFIFGAAIGSADVAINAQAVVLQEKMSKQIMSTLHGMFSLGGLAGSLGIGLLLKVNLSPTLAALSIMLSIIIVLLIYGKTLLASNCENKLSRASFVIPKGPILILGGLCFIVYLAEGAMLDWSAIFLQFSRSFDPEFSGLGYAMFSIAMAVMRFKGDSLVIRYGSTRVVFYGACLAAVGYLFVATIPSSIGALLGYLLVGLGLANIVPIFFSTAGKFPNVPAAIAIPALTTVGYSGFLIGPALIGFVADWFSLALSFGLLSLSLLIVAIAFQKLNQRFLNSV